MLFRRAIRAVVLVAVVATGVAAQHPVLGCVTPRATIDRKTAALHRTWIDVYAGPSAHANRMSYNIASPLPLWVVGKSGGFFRVTTGESMRGWPFRPHALLGWVRTADVEDQAIRNCT